MSDVSRFRLHDVPGLDVETRVKVVGWSEEPTEEGCTGGGGGGFCLKARIFARPHFIALESSDVGGGGVQVR